MARSVGVFLSHAATWIQRPYGAPRRFGMAALMTVVTAFAAFFALFASWKIHPFGVAVVAFYLVAVAIAQAVLLRGTSPRATSVLVGWPIWIAVFPAILILPEIELSGFYPGSLLGCYQ